MHYQTLIARYRRGRLVFRAGRPVRARHVASELIERLEARVLLAASTPQLLVYAGSTTFVNDATTVDFGTTIKGSVGVTRTFWVQNTASVSGKPKKGHDKHKKPDHNTLVLSHLSVPEGYSIADNLASSLAPGASDSFTIHLDSSTLGAMSGQVSVTSNDPKQHAFAFYVKGRVVAPPAPRIVVRVAGGAVVTGATTIDFGSIVQATAAPSRSFTITNTGNALLVLGAVQVPAGYTLVSGLPASLAPGGSATFTVRLDSAVVGAKSGSIRFHTNVAGHDPFSFAVSGRVVGVTAALDSSGTLNITGTGGPDAIIFSGNSSALRVYNHGQAIGVFAGVAQIAASGGGGDDLIDASGLDIPVYLAGGSGNDTLEGGFGNDTLHGGDGSDVLTGSFGVDQLYGDGGDDAIDAIDGTPDAVIDGGSGANTIRRDPTDPR